jgi:hypothetical protein
MKRHVVYLIVIAVCCTLAGFYAVQSSERFQQSETWRYAYWTETVSAQNANNDLADMTAERDALVDQLEREKQAVTVADAKACAALTAAENLERTVRGRVVDLPEDGDNLHTIVFLQPDWEKRPNEKRFMKLFDTEKWCLDLRARTHTHIYTIDKPDAKPYFKFVKATPCLMILKCDGKAGQILYNEPNPDLAKKPDRLLHQINVTRKRQRHGNEQPFNCPDGICPINPKPDQDKKAAPPTDGPDSIELPAKEEEKKPEAPPVPETKGLPVAVAIAIPIVVFGVGLVGFLLLSHVNGVKKAQRRIH